MIRTANTREQLVKCFSVISELRSHLDVDMFLAMVDRMRAEGYQIAFLTKNGEVISCAGFRFFETLFAGKNLYIDDLVTIKSCRSQGHGKALIEWLVSLAKDNGCDCIRLDSGTNRHNAHKFYLDQGFDIVCHHFQREIENR